VEGQNKSITFDGREIRLTTGLYAPQANGSVMIECGDTSLLVTATKTTKKEASDFLPLICDYEEKLYAAGRIPGGFMRREGRPPERATLISRLIDRPMRPLFPSWMRDEIQIVASCLSLDERVPADVLAVTGASIATLLGEIPFHGPMAAVRVGLIGDDFILNPSYREIEKGDLDIVVAGSPDGIVMIEAGANQLSEQDTIEAIKHFGVAIKGPLTTPIGGGIRSLNVALRQIFDLYSCVRPCKYYSGTPSPHKNHQNLDVIVYRENTEDIYMGIEWEADDNNCLELINHLNNVVIPNSKNLKNRSIPNGSGIGIKPVSKFGSQRHIRKAIEHAKRLSGDKRHVTLVHKGNIMKYTEGAFRDWGYELAVNEFRDDCITERESWI